MSWTWNVPSMKPKHNFELTGNEKLTLRFVVRLKNESHSKLTYITDWRETWGFLTLLIILWSWLVPAPLLALGLAAAPAVRSWGLLPIFFLSFLECRLPSGLLERCLLVEASWRSCWVRWYCRISVDKKASFRQVYNQECKILSVNCIKKLTYVLTL